MNLERIFAEIVKKTEDETRLIYTEHVDPPSLDTGMYEKNVKFLLRAPLNIPLEKRPPYPSVPTSNTLDFSLEFDAGHLIDFPEKVKKEMYRKARQVFIIECDKIHADDVVEITFAKDLRLKHLKACESNESVPMVYCPVGSLIQKSAPEVVSVSVLDIARSIF